MRAADTAAVARITWEGWLVRADSAPLDARAASAALAGHGLAGLPAKPTSDGAVLRLSAELCVDGIDEIDGGDVRAAVESRLVAVLAAARPGLGAAAAPHENAAKAKAAPSPASHTRHTMNAKAGAAGSAAAMTELATTLAGMGRRTAASAERRLAIAAEGAAPGATLELHDDAFVRLIATPVSVLAAEPVAVEAVLRLACEANHRLRLARVLAGAAGDAHVRLSFESVVPADGDLARNLDAGLAAVAFARAQLGDAARVLADPGAATTFLELRGVALEDAARSRTTGSLPPLWAAAS